MNAKHVRLAVLSALAAALTVSAAVPAHATTSQCVRVRDGNGNVVTMVCVPLP